MYWFGKDMFISEAYCKTTKFKFSIRVKVIDGAVFKEFASVRDSRDLDLISGLGRSPGKGNGTPLQYSCLENPVDREAWWATVHEVAKSQTPLSN